MESAMTINDSDNNNPDCQLLTRHDVAKLFQTSVRSIDRLTKDGLLPAVRFSSGKSGKRHIVRYRMQDIDRVLIALSQPE
jgi:hypothetical protein